MKSSASQALDVGEEVWKQARLLYVMVSLHGLYTIPEV